MHSEDDLRRLLAQKLADALEGPIPSGTRRRVHGRVWLPGKATAVVGMRRAGKTTFLHQLRRERLQRKVPRENLPYLNFEDERLHGLQAAQLNLVLEEYYRLHPEARGRETVTWCLDEIQGVPGWEVFVRRMLDTEKVEVFVSGSSASLLSREIATSMRGRAWEVVIHPFGFEEYLRHHGLEVPERPRSLAARARSKLERAFQDYLVIGGFPEAQGLDADTRLRLLRDYVDVAMLRDVVERHSVSNVTGLRWIVRQLLGNAGGLFSVEKIYASLRSQGLGIAKDTVHELLAHLEDCFLVRTAWVESDSERRRMVNPRKAYPVDPGLIPVFDRSGHANLGHALETVVRIELERRGASTTYVRTPSGREVDFLARFSTGAPELIQVCADPSGPETAAREFDALIEASALHPDAECLLLTLAHDRIPARVPAGVRVLPAYEWLISGAA